jgi:hypothetical protein
MRNGRNTELQWPDFYPENYPPVEAEPASGTVYRLVRHNPAQAEDFKSTWEEFPGRFPEPTIRNSGASVYTDPQDIERLKRRIPQLNDRKTAKGELNPTLGLIQRTEAVEKSHVTWWIPIGAEPWLVFEGINEERN